MVATRYGEVKPSNPHNDTPCTGVSAGVPIERIFPSSGLRCASLHRREWAKKANAHCSDEEGGTDKAGIDLEP